MRILEVIEPGPLSLVQDLGRPGWAALGVSGSGAFDRVSLALANRIVGNPEGLAGIEALMGGLVVQAHDALTLAVTGAEGALEISRGPGSAWRPVDRGAPVHLAVGDRLRISTPERGLRSYLAIRGGLAIEPVLDSCSSDTLSGLGPQPLTRGEALPIGPQPPGPIAVDHVVQPRQPQVLEVIPGPHHDDPHGLLLADALEHLQSADYRVLPSSDRIGVRLHGPVLPRRPGELASAPMRAGAIQVPGDGQPIVLGPDAPTTGGFPVLGTLTPAALSAIGQVRPGEAVRLRVLWARTMNAAE